MEKALLEILVCPLCKTSLSLQVDTQKGELIENGSLQCGRCHSVYPVKDEIPLMLNERFAYIQDKNHEIEGWVAMAKKDGWYVPDENVDSHLPYLNRDLGWQDMVWLANEISFDKMLHEYVQPGMKVLEVGAAKCWGGHYFAERGCAYVGTDILADVNMGLGRGRFYIDRFGYHFERVQADGEYLPFRSGTFDLTYAVAALHHSMHLEKMIREMARVTRRGGLVIALNEGFQPFRANSNPDIQSHEKSFGINEHVHPITRYIGSFWQSGLMIMYGEPAIGLGSVPAAQSRRFLQLRRLPVVGTALSLIYLLGFVGKDCSGMSLYARKLW